MSKVKKVMRVGIYVRVSTEEQKKHGYSVLAQLDDLNDYIKEHKELKLVDTYVDDGVSAVKLKKRLELQRLLNDVRDGKIDLILFTKLDRWGRSVDIYYQIQNVLDQYNVSWKAIHEDYEIETASGKFKVNIMMSVAQQERDKGSERIKDVFNYKLKNCEALTGAMPFGYMIKEIEGKKRIVRKPDEEPILRDLIQHYKTYNSLRLTFNYGREKYGEKSPSYARLNRIFKNPFLYGHFRGIDDYCEAYMNKDEFDELQLMLTRNMKKRNTNHTYIFSKLIKCPVCGGKLTGGATRTYHANGEKVTHLCYRCENHYLGKKDCTFNVSKSQLKIERAVLDKLQPTLTKYLIDCEAKEEVAVKKVDVSKLKDELERLNNMYLKGRIDEDVYDKKYIELNNKIKTTVSVKSEFKVNEAIKDLKGINILDLYNSFTIEEKQRFMRGIIKEIIIDKEYNILEIIFL